MIFNYYVYGNQQHCFINTACNNRDEVEKPVADFQASNLKEFLLKDIRSLVKGWKKVQSRAAKNNR